MDLNAFVALVTSLTINVIPDYIMPNLGLILASILILVAAFISGKVGKFLTSKLLKVVGLAKLAERSWAENVLKYTGYKGSIIELIGDLVKWLIYIVFLAFLLQTIGLLGATAIFLQVATFVPRLIGAVLIIVIGFIIADFFGKVFQEAGLKMLGDETLGRFIGGIIRYTVGMITFIMALAMIGIDIVALSILLGAVLVMVIILSTVGIKDLLPELTAGLYLKGRLRVGQKVKVGEYSGAVEGIDPLVTRIHTKKSVVYLPNTMLTRCAVEKENGRH